MVCVAANEHMLITCVSCVTGGVGESTHAVLFVRMSAQAKHNKLALVAHSTGLETPTTVTHSSSSVDGGGGLA